MVQFERCEKWLERYVCQTTVDLPREVRKFDLFSSPQMHMMKFPLCMKNPLCSPGQRQVLRNFFSFFRSSTYN